MAPGYSCHFWMSAAVRTSPETRTDLPSSLTAHDDNLLLLDGVEDLVSELPHWQLHSGFLGLQSVTVRLVLLSAQLTSMAWYLGWLDFSAQIFW